MDDWRDIKSILKKLMILNSSRMAQIRDSFVATKDEEAEYEDRYREQRWYEQAIKEINIQIVGKDLKISKEALQLKIRNKLEARYDEVLEKTRQNGEGTIPDDNGTLSGQTPMDPDDPKRGPAYANRISLGDREFLESCGIKTERGEDW